jgi:hypothetical protein
MYVFLALVFVPKEHQDVNGSYTLQHLLTHGRQDHKAYTWFVNVYLTCTVGVGHDKGLIEKSPSDVFTVDDEVLVLWLMENNWEIWADMKKRNNTKTSTLNPKFTVTGGIKEVVRSLVGGTISEKSGTMNCTI